MGLFDNGVDDELAMENGGILQYEDEDVSEDMPDVDEMGGDEEAGDEAPAEDEGDEDLAEESDFLDFEDDELTESEVGGDANAETTVGGDGLDEQMNPAADVVDSDAEAKIDNPDSEPSDAPAPEVFDVEEDITPEQVEANNG